MKLGVLLPTSKLYPTLPSDVLSGIRLALKEQNVVSNIEITFQGIENGSNKELIINELNKMVLQNQVDVNILFINPMFTQEIATAAIALERPLIITHIGGNITNNQTDVPYVLTNSLNLWESAFTASFFGIGKFGKKVAHGSYFYEAGYKLYQAFMSGVQKNNGEIAFNQIAEFNPNPNDYSNFMTTAREEKPDFLYLLYSERDAVAFLNNLVKSPENGLYPIVTSGVLINDEIIKKVKGIPKNVYNVCSWDKALKNATNKKFISGIQRETGKDANYFSLLGFECGMAIALGYQNKTWSNNGLDQYEAIKKSTFEGPRGAVNFISGNGMTQYNNYVFTLNGQGDTVQQECLGKVKERDTLIEDFQKEEKISGWYQPYLCQ